MTTPKCLHKIQDRMRGSLSKKLAPILRLVTAIHPTEINSDTETLTAQIVAHQVAVCRGPNVKSCTNLR